MRLEKKSVIDTSELRTELENILIEHKKLIRMSRKFEEYYSEHEDRIAALDKKITQAEKDTGLTREQVIAKVEDDALADLLPEA